MQFPSVAKKRMSLCTLGGSKCQEVRFLCFSRALPLSPTSAQSAAVSFPAKHNTSKKDLSCHAKISVSTTAPLSAPAAPQAEVAGEGGGFIVPQCFPHSHMLVSQVGDKLLSPGIRWMSDLNTWFSTLSPLWLLSVFTSAPWVQF